MRGWPLLRKTGYWFRQWQSLKPWEQRTLFRMAVLFPLIWLGLRLLGFKRMQRLAQPEISFARPPRLPRGYQADGYAQRCAELSAIAGRHGLYRANCLHQSLVLCRLLRGRGLKAQLRVGVKPRVQPFQAHAWVEMDCKILGQTLDEYVPFPNLMLPDETESTKQ